MGTPSDLDQRLKSAIREANMRLIDEQHHLVRCIINPYLKSALLQEKISTQAKVMEVAMRLHETLIPNLGLGVQQIQAQVQNLCLEMHKLKQEQTPCSKFWEEVWCVRCKSKGHDKDHCLVLVNFVITRGPTLVQPEA